MLTRGRKRAVAYCHRLFTLVFFPVLFLGHRPTPSTHARDSCARRDSFPVVIHLGQWVSSESEKMVLVLRVLTSVHHLLISRMKDSNIIDPYYTAFRGARRKIWVIQASLVSLTELGNSYHWYGLEHRLLRQELSLTEFVHHQCLLPFFHPVLSNRAKTRSHLEATHTL